MDIGPGDEVVAALSFTSDDGNEIIEGRTYRVASVGRFRGRTPCATCGNTDHPPVKLEGQTYTWPVVGWCPCAFRKPPPPRELAAWLHQPVKFEGPKRVRSREKA